MKLAIASAAIGFLAAYASPVFAVGSASHSRVATAGTACVAISGTATPSSTGSVANNSTTTPLTVDCPIGYNFSFTGEWAPSIRVRGAFRTNGQAVTCTVYLESLAAGGWYSATIAMSAAIGRRVASSGAIGHYELTEIAAMHVACTLPPKNGNGANTIYGFETEEY